MFPTTNEKKLQNDLEELFSIVPPCQLRKSIHEIFSRYLQTINSDTDLACFKSLAEDFYFLYKFLEEAEKEVSKSNNIEE